MKLSIPTFDDFKLFLKENADVNKGTEQVDTAAFIGKLPFKFPFITDDHMGWSANEQAVVLPVREIPMTILHEAWHYFMAPPDMLKYNNYGLPTPIGGERMKEERKRDGVREEEAVCYLTIATAMELHLPIAAIMDEVEYANLIEPFVHEKANSRKEYAAIMELIESRSLSRFGLKVSLP